MANKIVEICVENCPGRYNSTPEDIAEVEAKQRILGNDPVLSERCLGVCSLIGAGFPKESIVNVRISGDGLNRAPGIVGRDANDQIRTGLLNS